MQFRGVPIYCHDDSCSGHYVPKGPAPDRAIHGLKSEVYVLQFEYRCSNTAFCPMEQKSFQSAAVLKTSRCPDFIQVESNKHFHFTHNSGVTGELLTYILNDALSPKSFEDIQSGIKAFREKEYVDRCVEYQAAREYYCHTHDLPLTSFPEFSAMDDPSGYNSPPNEPSTNFIIEIFQSHVEAHESVMESVIDDRAPSSVWSYDHSFNTNKRTKEREEPPPPELLPPGAAPSTKYTAVQENASLYIMGADGMVSCSSIRCMVVSYAVKVCSANR